MVLAFFSASETALTSLNKIKLRNMAEDKRKMLTSSKTMDDPNRLLSFILIGNNLVNNAAAAFNNNDCSIFY